MIRLDVKLTHLIHRQKPRRSEWPSTLSVDSIIIIYPLSMDAPERAWSSSNSSLNWSFGTSRHFPKSRRDRDLADESALDYENHILPPILESSASRAYDWSGGTLCGANGEQDKEKEEASRECWLWFALWLLDSTPWWIDVTGKTFGHTRK